MNKEIIFKDLSGCFLFYPNPGPCEIYNCQNNVIEGSFCYGRCQYGHMCLSHAVEAFMYALDADRKLEFTIILKKWLQIHPEVAL